VLLIVMHESGTWRMQPGQTLTFGRGQACTIKLPASDRGLSRSAGSLSFRDGCWWLHNDSASSVLYLSGDRGFRVDLPPGMQTPVQPAETPGVAALKLRRGQCPVAGWWFADPPTGGRAAGLTVMGGLDRGRPLDDETVGPVGGVGVFGFVLPSPGMPAGKVLVS
jgi:hypothetical protein